MSKVQDFNKTKCRKFFYFVSYQLPVPFLFLIGWHKGGDEHLWVSGRSFQRGETISYCLKVNVTSCRYLSQQVSLSGISNGLSDWSSCFPGVSWLWEAFPQTYQASAVHRGGADRGRRGGERRAPLASWWHHQWCNTGPHQLDRWGHHIQSMRDVPEQRWHHQVVLFFNW